MRFNSFKFKISVLFALLLGAVLILYSFFLYWGLSTTLYDELDKELKAKAAVTSNVLGLYMRAAGDSTKVVEYAFNRISFPEDVDARLEIVAKIDMYWSLQLEKMNTREDLMQLVGPDGKVVGKSRRLSHDLGQVFLERLQRRLREETSDFLDIHYKNRVLRLISAPYFFNGKGPYILQIAVSQKPLIQLLQSRSLAILTSIPIIFLLTFFIGWLLVNQMMRPVVAVTKAAESLSHKDLGARVVTRYGDEEMRRLVAAFNDMIARLEQSFRHIEEFSSQVAHELRTPLAIMRGESELALRKDRDPQEYRRVIRVNLEEIGRMLRTVEDLLLLARLDYHPDIFKKVPLDLLALCQEVVEQAQILIEGKGIALKMESALPGAIVSGDAHHLRRLFFNLLHNAIKFTPAGGSIVITIERRSHQILVSVTDTGVGIAVEDLPRVFERFFHKDQGIVTDDPGSGLGLSIALSVARGHGGDIQGHSQLGKGTVFIVSLPLAG